MAHKTLNGDIPDARHNTTEIVRHLKSTIRHRTTLSEMDLLILHKKTRDHFRHKHHTHHPPTASFSHVCAPGCVLENVGCCYACVHSGVMHFCTNFDCELAIADSEGRTCPLTGLQFTSLVDNSNCSTEVGDTYGQGSKSDNSSAKRARIDTEEDMTHDAQPEYEGTHSDPDMDTTMCINEPLEHMSNTVAQEQKGQTASTSTTTTVKRKRKAVGVVGIIDETQRMYTQLQQATDVIKKVFVLSKTDLSLVPIQQLAQRAWELWNLFHTCLGASYAHATYKFEYHCLVVVYKSRTGYDIGGYQILPREEICDNLTIRSTRTLGYKANWYTPTNKKFTEIMHSVYMNHSEILHQKFDRI